MSTAEQIVRITLEAQRHTLMLRQEALRQAGPQLAYDILMNDSFIAKQEMRDAEDELGNLVDQIALHDLALIEARRRVILHCSARRLQRHRFGRGVLSARSSTACHSPSNVRSS
jgi:hypothetical protein